MKLGALKAAIRALTVPPLVELRGMNLALQKTPLLAELDRVYPGGKSQETGLRVEADGKLYNDTGEQP